MKLLSGGKQLISQESAMPAKKPVFSYNAVQQIHAAAPVPARAAKPVVRVVHKPTPVRIPPKTPRPEDVGSPLLLHAPLTIAANQTASFPQLALKHKGLFMVKEIRLTAQAQNAAFNPAASIGPILGLTLRLGDIPLTAGNIPIGVLCPSYSHAQESDVISTGWGGIAATYLDSNFVWKLKYPLLVKNGEQLLAHLTHSGGMNIPYAARVSYVGWSLPSNFPIPKVRKIPYTASWVPAAVSLNGTAQTSSSSEKDLANPFSAPLEIERIGGRLYRATAAGNLGYQETSFDNTVAALWRQTQIQIRSAEGHQVVRDPTFFYNVFNWRTSGIDLAHVLSPRSYYTIDLTMGGTPVQDGIGVAQFSLCGWREV
jgi:hypothetical protein